MSIWRILKGKLSMNWCPWQPWIYCSFDKYWGGRIFTLSISKISTSLDCRSNWLEDMATGRIK